MIGHRLPSYSGLRRDFEPSNRITSLSFRGERDLSRSPLRSPSGACPREIISAGTSDTAAAIQFSQIVFRGVFGAVSALPGLRRIWHRLGDWLLD